MQTCFYSHRIPVHTFPDALMNGRCQLFDVNGKGSNWKKSGRNKRYVSGCPRSVHWWCSRKAVWAVGDNHQLLSRSWWQFDYIRVLPLISSIYRVHITIFCGKPLTILTSEAIKQLSGFEVWFFKNLLSTCGIWRHDLRILKDFPLSDQIG